MTPPSEVDAVPEASTVVCLPDELLQLIFKQACNVLDPGAAVSLSSASHGLWTATQALLPQLKADSFKRPPPWRVGPPCARPMLHVKPYGVHNTPLYYKHFFSLSPATI